jgi:hypothetical protein
VTGVAAHRGGVGDDLCRHASSAPSAAGRTALADHDNCGRRNRGTAAADDEEAAIVVSKMWSFPRISPLDDGFCQDVKCYVIADFGLHIPTSVAPAFPSSLTVHHTGTRRKKHKIIPRGLKLPSIVAILSHANHQISTVKNNAHRLLCTAAAKPTNIQKRPKPCRHPIYRPYSKLGTMTGPYFIGALYPPSFCTIKSIARLSLPLP